MAGRGGRGQGWQEGRDVGSQFRSPICFRTACGLLSRTKVCFDINEPMRVQVRRGMRVGVQGAWRVWDAWGAWRWRQRSVRLIGD